MVTKSYNTNKIQFADLTNFSGCATVTMPRVIKRVLGGERDRCQKAEPGRREEDRKPSARKVEAGRWRGAKETAGLLEVVFCSPTGIPIRPQ